VGGFGTGTKSSREYSSDGHLEMETSKVDSYLATFMSRIFIMHPFLDATDLRTMRDGFAARYIPQSQHPGVVGLDRKVNRRGRIHLSSHPAKVQLALWLEDAIMLLVLALGAICEYHVEAPLRKTESQHLGRCEDRGWTTPGLVYFEKSVQIVARDLRRESDVASRTRYDFALCIPTKKPLQAAIMHSLIYQLIAAS
jgi:hypothetical protein